MINISIAPDGSISIHQESVEERSAVQAAANQMVASVKGDPRSDETIKDEEAEKWFKTGYESAIGLALMAKETGGPAALEEFFESNVVGYKNGGSEEPDADGAETVEGIYQNGGAWGPKTKAAWEEAGFDTAGEALTQEDMLGDVAEPPSDHGVPLPSAKQADATAIHLAGATIAVKAEDAGEEDDGTRVNAGVWTITDDELRSRMSEEYRRGRLDQQSIYNAGQRRVVRKQLMNGDQD